MRKVKSGAKSSVMKFKSCLMAVILCAGVSPGAQARYYDPDVARFISADEFVQNVVAPQSLNRTSYVQNNPLTATDPSGHFIWVPILVGAAMGGTNGQIFNRHAWSDFNWQNAAIGAVAAAAGYGAGSWAFTAAGKGAAGIFAGGIAGGFSSGAVGGTLAAAAGGGDIFDGFVSGAVIGGISGGFVGAVGAAGVAGTPGPGGLENLLRGITGGAIGNAMGSFVAAYVMSLGNSNVAKSAASRSFNGAILASTLNAYTPLDKYGKGPIKDGPLHNSMMAADATFVVAPDPSFDPWNLFALLVGNGYSHTWHADDGGDYSHRDMQYIQNNVPHRQMPSEIDFLTLTNNCTTRYGDVHPGLYISRHRYIHKW